MKYFFTICWSLCLSFGTLTHAQLVLESEEIEFRPRPFTCIVSLINPVTVPVTNALRDQYIQGPCYIFAMVAALESRAIQSCLPAYTGFHEWSFYNSCLLTNNTGITGNGHTMVNKVVDAGLNEGLPDRTNPLPHSPAEVPNPNDPTAPGIGDFNCLTYCGDRLFSYEKDPSGNCLDNENSPFLLTGVSGKKYKIVQGPPLGTLPSYVPSLTTTQSNAVLKHIDMDNVGWNDKKHTMMYLLGQGYGIVAFFTNWREGRGHSVFIYGTNGCDWMYKDSWPQDPGLKNDRLDLDKLTDVYFMTGLIQEEGVSYSELEIVANESQSPVTYTAVGGLDNPCDIDWTVTGGATILSGQGTRTITVNPGNCATNPVDITVNLTVPNLSCTASHRLEAVPPTSLLAVQGAYWDDGTRTACPDETYTAQTDFYPGATYEWYVSGMHINGTQDQAQISLHAPSVTFANLDLKVRSFNACRTNAWTGLSGQIDANGILCDGGIVRLADESLLTIADRMLIWHGQLISPNKLNEPVCFSLSDLNGRPVYQKHLSANEERIPLTAYASGLYLVTIEGAGIMLREKILLR